jgi:hypothetical protein
LLLQSLLSLLLLSLLLLCLQDPLLDSILFELHSSGLLLDLLPQPHLLLILPLQIVQLLHLHFNVPLVLLLTLLHLRDTLVVPQLPVDARVCRAARGRRKARGTPRPSIKLADVGHPEQPA